MARHVARLQRLCQVQLVRRLRISVVFAFFKDELEARKSLKAFFYSQNLTKYSLEHFLSICGEKMSEGFLKFYKLIIKPDTRSDHCLQTCIN